jgi:hypothetical protein
MLESPDRLTWDAAPLSVLFEPIQADAIELIVESSKRDEQNVRTRIGRIEAFGI